MRRGCRGRGVYREVQEREGRRVQEGGGEGAGGLIQRLSAGMWQEFGKEKFHTLTQGGVLRNSLCVI